MAKLAAPKKPTAKAAPKKPTSRSKTGNSACSEAASNWQLSLRGKAALNPETYQTLAKCRAMNRTAKMAEGQSRTGKLSAMGEAAVKGRLQSRFDSGLITQKSRTEKLNMLLKQRGEREKPAAPAKAADPSEAEIGDLIQSAKDRYLRLKREGILQSVESHNKIVRPDHPQPDFRTPITESAFDPPRLPRQLGANQAVKYIEQAWPDYKHAIGGTKVAIKKALETGEFKTGYKKFAVEYNAGNATPSGVGRFPITYTTWQREEIDRAAAMTLAAQKAQSKAVAARKSDPKPISDTFILKPPPQPGISTRSQGVMFGTDTELDRMVRAENAAKPKPMAGQGDMFDVSTQRLAPAVMAPPILSPRLSTPLKSTVKAVKGKLLARAENQSGVATLRTGSIMADPERFQYKMNTSGPVGVTDQFRETKTWNKELAGVVQVWKDPANGKTYVVNGHHRFELAQRFGVKSLNVQYIKAKDAAEARTKGALTNIAEGRGTSVDAGKFFREQGNLDNVVEDLKKRGISLSERTAAEGLALARTAPKIWRDVVDEMTPVSRAVAIGKSGLRDEDQLQIYRKATEGNWRSGKTEEFATELKRAPLVKVGSASLFGDDDFVNVAEHRAALADRFKMQLKSGKKLFGTVARSRNAGRLESAGNKIDRETSAAIAAQNDQALMAFDIERKYGSRTSRLLDRYATQIAQGDKLDRVYGGFEARATRALQRDIEKPFEQRLARRKARLAALVR